MSKALHPGAREGQLPSHAVRGLRIPALHVSPRERDESSNRQRPYYAPQHPVGPSHDEIRGAKGRIVRHRKSVADIKLQIANAEALLTTLDPQMVVACVVPGYTDPPERVARANADREAGIKTVFTPDDAAKIARGEMEPPDHPGIFPHQIHDLKTRIGHLQMFVDHTTAHNDYIEYDLDQLDPHSVCAAHVADYHDPPERIAKNRSPA